MIRTPSLALTLWVCAASLIWSTGLRAHQPGDEFADWYHSLMVPGVDPHIINHQSTGALLLLTG
jgi:hypothetical protein